MTDTRKTQQLVDEISKINDNNSFTVIDRNYRALPIPYKALVRRIHERTNSVFHYTSSDGFLDIIKNNRIRISKLTNFNDYDEISYGTKVISGWLEENKIRGFNFNGDQNCEIFALCATSLQDDAAMWDRYTKGDGYCIELIKPQIQHDNYEVFFEGMLYIPQKWNRILYGADDAKEILSYEIKALGDEVSDDLLGKLAVFKYLIKKESWQQESEWRKLFILLPDGNSLKFFETDTSKVNEYAYVGPVIDKYSEETDLGIIDGGLEKADEKIVKSVRLGPNISNEAHKDEVINVLNSYGYDTSSIDVSVSEVRFSRKG
ncbi:MAG: DUF2971 domain-containing protein [Candidatus Ancillula sp.]|nr:DUF2971 domain-containing protein [Candidatus Ancillula sp.]